MNDYNKNKCYSFIRSFKTEFEKPSQKISPIPWKISLQILQDTAKNHTHTLTHTHTHIESYKDINQNFQPLVNSRTLRESLLKNNLSYNHISTVTLQQNDQEKTSRQCYLEGTVALCDTRLSSSTVQQLRCTGQLQLFQVKSYEKASTATNSGYCLQLLLYTGRAE